MAGHTCTVCGKSTKHAHSLRMHMKVHERVPLQCSQCPRAFKTSWELKRHVGRLHRPRPKIHCKYCTKVTRYKKVMFNHVRAHHPTVRTCEFCAKQYKSIGAYRVHRHRHLTGAGADSLRFKCPACRMTFNSRVARTSHMTHCGRRRRVQVGGGETQWESEAALKGAAVIHRVAVRGEEETKDVNVCMISYKLRIVAKLKLEVTRLKGIKFWLSVVVGASKDSDSAGAPSLAEKHLRSDNHILMPADDILQSVQECILEVIRAVDKILLEDSGWQITAVYYIELGVGQFKPLGGSSFIELPTYLRNSKFKLLNIRNGQDRECFRWSLIAGLFPYRGAHRERLAHYRPHYHAVNFGRLESECFKVKDIPRFLNLNPTLSLTVLALEGRKTFYPIFASKEERENHIALLLLVSGTRRHYVLVESLDSLLYCVNSHRERKYFCRFCLNHWSNLHEKSLHELSCRDFGVQRTRLPEQGAILSFDSKMFPKTELQEFIIFWDLEARMNQVRMDEGKRTARRFEHVISMYCIIVCNHRGERLLGPIVYTAEQGVGEHFITTMIQLEEELFRMRKEYPIHWTAEAHARHLAATHCDLCHEALLPGQFVADHCHFEQFDNVRSTLCGGPNSRRQCNMLRRRSPRVVAICFNNQNYDNHLVFRCAVNHPDLQGKKISVLAKTKTKYITWSLFTPGTKRRLTFIDAYLHFHASLSSLAETLQPEDLIVTKDVFGDPELSSLMCRKLPYPYEYFDSYARYFDPEIPAREHFYSTLRQESISVEEHAFAVSLYEKLGCTNLLQFTRAYVTSDTCILADIWGAHRRQTYKMFGLEATAFVSGASLSFACALKYTQAKIELISCPEQFNFVERSLRGGQSLAVTRHYKANHPAVPDYDSSKPHKYITAVDLTALYGGCLMGYLPCGEYSWVDQHYLQSEFNLEDTREDDDYSHFIEVSLSYPAELHRSHSDFPLAPLRMTITPDLLSEHQHDMMLAGGIKLGPAEERLVAHLGPREKYVVHALTLKYYVDRGMHIEQYHRGLRFRQKPIFKDYMTHLTQIRQAAILDFVIKQTKALGNYLYGKLLQTNRKHINVDIVQNLRHLRQKISKPNFHSFEIIGDDLVLVQTRPTVINLNTPVAAGSAILDKSKVVAFRTYHTLKDFWGDNLTVLGHDTDGWSLGVQTLDVFKDFEQIQNLNHNFFDFSNFPKNHYLFSDAVKRVPHTLKVEHPMKVICESVHLRAKVYALRFIAETLKKCKGADRTSLEKQVDFPDYKRCVFDSLEKEIRYFYLRGDKDHVMYTWEAAKTALRNFDAKRVILPDGLTTRPFFYDPSD